MRNGARCGSAETKAPTPWRVTTRPCGENAGDERRSLGEQRAVWEDQYAKAHARWEAHVKQQAEAKQAEVEAGEATSYSSSAGDDEAETGGSLASDEALQALREKLTGGQ